MVRAGLRRDPPSMTTYTTQPTLVRRLTRSRSDKVLGGVAGGLGQHFGVDPVLFRIGFAVSVLFSGAGIIAYLVMLAVVPAPA
jgi:phage shock protein PspC (stress-responsive transcriptional regulator)